MSRNLTEVFYMLTLCACVFSNLVNKDTQWHTSSTCCLPHQWEGYLDSISATANGSHPSLHTRVGSLHIHVDYTGKRMSLSHTLRDGNSTVQYQVIDNYVTRQRAVIRDMNCTLKSLNHTMREPCVPDNAQKMSTGYIGGLTERVNVVNWQLIQSPDEDPQPGGPPGGGDGVVRLITTEEDCIPVNIVSQQTYNNASFTLSGGFHRITTGIRDSDVFDIPEECYEGLVVLPVVFEDVYTVLSTYM